MKLSISTLLLLFSLLFNPVLTVSAPACDLCACHVPSPESSGPLPAADGGLRLHLAAATQFTRFGSLRLDGHEVDNPTGQRLDSAITQVVLGLTLPGGRLAFQANLPLIQRSYRRPEGFAVERGHESGPGDLALLASLLVSPLPAGSGQENGASLRLLAGVKLPTGDSSRIREEFDESETEGAPPSGIHGHDLALGTGSLDAIAGAQLLIRRDSFFLEAETQFTLRGPGRHSYHFANDLLWSVGPGCTVLRPGDGALSVQLLFSGEHKRTDRFQGREAEDTGMTAIYLGPQVRYTGPHVSAEVGLDLPVLLDNTALQIVPDYRLRAAVTVSF